MSQTLTRIPMPILRDDHPLSYCVHRVINTQRCHQTYIGEKDLTRLVAYAVFVRIVQTEIHPSCCTHIDQVYEDAVEDTTETALMHGLLDSFHQNEIRRAFDFIR